MTRREAVLAWIAFAIVCVVWGTTYLAIRIAIETVPTLLLAGFRFTLAGAILLGACALFGQKIPRRVSDWWTLTIVGFLLIGVGNVVVVWAEHFMTSGFAALLVATAPSWMAVIESIRTRGSVLTGRKAIGLAIGFSGVALLVAPDLRPSAFDSKFLLGVIALQAGAICWNLGSVISKYRPVESSTLAAAAVQMLMGGIIVLTGGLLTGELSQLSVNTRTLTAWLYLMVFGSIIAYGAYVYALSKLSTSTVSLYAYINPVIAVVVGWLILDEPLGWRAIAAMTIILFGAAMVQSKGMRIPRFAKNPQPMGTDIAA